MWLQPANQIVIAKTCNTSPTPARRLLQQDNLTNFIAPANSSLHVLLQVIEDTRECITCWWKTTLKLSFIHAITPTMGMEARRLLYSCNNYLAQVPWWLRITRFSCSLTKPITSGQTKETEIQRHHDLSQKTSLNSSEVKIG